MRHPIFLKLIFSVFLLAKVHGEDFPDCTPFLQDEPFFQDDSFLQADGDIALAYDDSTTDLFTDENLTANPSNNNCFSYDNVDNIFFPSDTARRVRLLRKRETCPDPNAPPLIPPTDIYDSNTILNLLSPLSPSPNSPVTSGSRKKDPDHSDLERLFGLPLPAPKLKDENDDCPAVLYGDSRIPVCDLGDFVKNVEIPLGELHATVYNVRICKLDQRVTSFLNE